MTRAVLELRQPVAAPAEVVWAEVVDWPAQGEWMLGTSVEVAKGDGESVGSELAAFTGVGPVGFLDTMVITSFDAPRECRVEHTGKLVRGIGVFGVEPHGERESVFVWREELDLPLGALGRLGWPLVKPGFALGVKYSLRKLAKRCEDRAR